MYQPYLRGKQFELIGLRELVDNVLVHYRDKISPIIEPVKDSSTFKSTLIELLKKDINFTIIVNPQKGTFDNTNKILEILSEIVGDNRNYQVGIIFHSKINHNNLISKLETYSAIIPVFSIIHDSANDDIERVLPLYNNIAPIKYNVINLDIIQRRYTRNFDSHTLVELGDFFKSQERNSDYLEIDESSFSEEHIYYKEEGFVGFSDFLTVGKGYSESGFLPYAVAIHLSYADDRDRIRVKHFVSDSNDDTSDIGGKFSEALKKLIEWCDRTHYSSYAVDQFRTLYDNGNVHFPGLGSIKKLSIVNHIELTLKKMH